MSGISVRSTCIAAKCPKGVRRKDCFPWREDRKKPAAASVEAASMLSARSLLKLPPLAASWRIPTNSVAKRCYGSGIEQKQAAIAPLLIRPAETKAGLCGLPIYRPKDITQLTNDIIKECDQRVAQLHRYKELTPKKVRFQLCINSILIILKLLL